MLRHARRRRFGNVAFVVTFVPFVFQRSAATSLEQPVYTEFTPTKLTGNCLPVA